MVLHLDCNEQLPQCSDPMKITWRPTTRLDFAQFERYSEIKVYAFIKHHAPHSEIEDKTKFIKDIVEESVVAEVAEAAEDSEDSSDMTERHQELSQYGSMGKAP